jgi:hypothetical protein
LEAATLAGMTGIQPELWIDRAGAAVAFYGAAFGARVLHRVGEGDEIGAAGHRRRCLLGFLWRARRAAVQPEGDRRHDRPDVAAG